MNCTKIKGLVVDGTAETGLRLMPADQKSQSALSISSLQPALSMRLAVRSSLSERHGQSPTGVGTRLGQDESTLSNTGYCSSKTRLAHFRVGVPMYSPLAEDTTDRLSGIFSKSAKTPRAQAVRSAEPNAA